MRCYRILQGLGTKQPAEELFPSLRGMVTEAVSDDDDDFDDVDPIKSFRDIKAMLQVDDAGSMGPVFVDLD